MLLSVRRHIDRAAVGKFPCCLDDTTLGHTTVKKIQTLVLTIGMSLASVSGCSTVDIAGTRALQPDVPPLQSELHIQYSELALREMTEGKPVSAKRYNDKALQAAAGIRVMPEKPEGQEMMVQYDLLMNFIGSGSPSPSPATLARAQVMFDCWLEERMENIDPGDIAACKQAFEVAIQSREAGVPLIRQQVN